MLAYNQLDEQTRQLVITTYQSQFRHGQNTFRELALSIDVSERAFSRVLKDNNINTKRKNKYTLNEDYFSNIDSEEKAYLLGLIYADGCVNINRYVAFQSKDYEMVARLKMALEYTGEIREVIRTGGYDTKAKSYRINFSSDKINKDLTSLGRNNLPMVFPSIDDKYMFDFIRGYFDGDGSTYYSTTTSYYKDKIYKYKTCTFSIIGTVSILEDIRAYLKKYGITFTELEQSQTENMFYLKTTDKSSLSKLEMYLYDNTNCYLQRKFEKLHDFNNLTTHRIN